MAGIMGDHDIEGQFAEILRVFKSPTWDEVWEGMGFSVESFATLGLATNSPDALVWQICQERELILITGNRNNEGPDSLEATIRWFNRPDSLPVFTISNPRRFSSRAYVERVAEKLLEYLSELHKYRGTGRMYVP